MKYLLFISAWLVFSVGNAQDLRQFVPNDAIFVGSINGSNIFEPITISQLDQSKFGQKILEKFSRSVGFEVASFNDFGVNTSAHTYFYYASNDSLAYTTLIAPLSNTTFFDHFAATEGSEVIDNGNFKYIKVSGSNYIAWDKQKLIVINGKYINSYFIGYDFSKAEAEVAAQGYSTDDYYGTEPMVEAEYEEETSEGEVAIAAVMDEAVQANETEEITRDFIPYLYNYQLQLYADSFYEFCESIKEAAKNNDRSAIEDLKYQVEELQDLAAQVDSISDPDPTNLDNYIDNKTHYAKTAVDQIKDRKIRESFTAMIDTATFKSGDFIIYEYKYDDYAYGDYKDYYVEKQVLEDRWTENMLQSVMVPAASSILKNKQYLTQYDGKAAINVWNSNLAGTLTDLYSGVSTAIIGSNYQSYDFMDGYGELSGNLYLEGTQTRVGVDITLSEEFAKKFERMGKQKMNKKFFRYINEENLLGYLTYKINTKNFLEEYPSIIAKTYSPLMGAAYQEEMKLGMAFFSLVLDEAAVSELVKGDVYFGLSGINEKEVTYLDYEYDEDYNYQEIEKTKMEKLPEFIVMATTKDEAFTHKLTNYLVKKALIEPENGYYKILDSNNDIPLDLFFVIKNDIFFLTTSPSEISAIVSDSFKAKVSTKHKKMMRAGNFSAFFNGSKFGQQFPFEETAFPNVSATKFAVENASDFYLKSSKIKNRKMHTELIMQIPDHQTNLINYMMSFVEHW